MRDESRLASAGHESRDHPMAPRFGIDQALAAGAPPKAPRHAGRRPGFVKKHKAARVHAALPHPPAAVLLGNRPVPFGSSQTLLWDGLRLLGRIRLDEPEKKRTMDPRN
jgi:hypothetical protein